MSVDKIADILKTHIYYKNIPEASRRGLEPRVREPAERNLNRHLSHFKPELVLLHAELAKYARRKVRRIELMAEKNPGPLHAIPHPHI